MARRLSDASCIATLRAEMAEARTVSNPAGNAKSSVVPPHGHEVSGEASQGHEAVR